MCKWKSQYLPDYRCDDSPLDRDPKGYCILHSDENKDIKAFKDKVEERITKGKLTSSGLETDKKIDLIGCYFPKDFDRQFFKGKEFKKATEFKEAIFSEAIFLQPIDFTGVTFSDTADFTLAIFSDKADFGNAIFKKGVCFLSASFAKEAVFRGTRFKKVANFDTTCFEGKVDFTWTEFSGWTFFFKNSKRNSVNLSSQPPGVAFPDNLIKKEKIRYDTNRKRLIFEDVMSAEERNQLRDLSEDSSYRKATEELFQKCQKLTLGNPTEFHHTRFLGKATFQDVHLSNCSFLHANIDKVDFRYCEFAKEEKKSFSIFTPRKQNVLRDEITADERVEDRGRGDTRFFAPLRMTKEEKKLREENYEPVRRLYQELKCNFENKKDWNTAGDFHYREMKCRRKTKGTLGRKFFSLEALYCWTSGYGERPWRAFFGVMVLILGFALFYLPPASNVSQLTSNTPTLPSPLKGEGVLKESPIKGEGKHVEISPKPTNPTLPDEGKGVESREEVSGKSLSMYIGKRYLDGLKTSLRTTFFLGKEEKGWPNTIQSILGPILAALFALALRRKVKR